MNATSLAAVTLAAHANAAASGGHSLRLHGHPAFLVVRRVRVAGGDLTAWFEQVRTSMAVDLIDAGLDRAAHLQTATAAWTLTDDGGLTLAATTRVEAAAAESVADASEALRDAARAQAPDAPASWHETRDRAIAILASDGTGEEVSDVAWPHFLLPASSPLPARRLAAAAATLWGWDQPGAWAGGDADAVRDALRAPVAAALRAAVAAAS